MAREKRVRFDANELEQLKETRETMYGDNADDVPLAMVVSELCEHYEKRQRFA